MLHLGLEADIVTRQLLMQPVGLVERPPGRGRLRPRPLRLDAKTAGVGNKPVIVMTSPEQSGLPGQHLGYKREDSGKEKARLKIWPNCYTVGPNLGGYTQWVR